MFLEQAHTPPSEKRSEQNATNKADDSYSVPGKEMYDWKLVHCCRIVFFFFLCVCVVYIINFYALYR
jgi:hypothetical protein